MTSQRGEKTFKQPKANQIAEKSRKDSQIAKRQSNSCKVNQIAEKTFKQPKGAERKSNSRKDSQIAKRQSNSQKDNQIAKKKQSNSRQIS